MLRIIYGPDSFTAHELLRQTFNACGQVQRENVRWIEGKSAKPDEILEACEQSTMFVDTIVVVCEGLLARFSRDEAARKPARGKKRSAKGPGDLMDQWEPFVQRVTVLPGSSVLVLLDAELKGSNPLLKLLTPHAEVTQCLPPARDALDRWIQERVATHGGRIDPGAAQRMGALVGSDLWLLTSEIEKLVVYADGSQIDVKMVEDMAAAGPAPSIFMLVDAIVERRERLARHRLDDMYQKGLSAGYVFTMIARQFRLIAQIHETRERREAAASSVELERLQSFALQKASEQASRYTPARVRDALERIVAADRGIKSGMQSDRVALELLISDLLRPAAS